MADRKESFLARMNAELDAIDAQIDQFRAQHRAGSTMGAKFESDDSLDALEQRRDAIRRRSRELEDLEGDDLEAARRDIENARNDLRRSLDEARERTRH